jgi:hypothetical protein
MSDSLPLFQVQAEGHTPGCSCPRCSTAKACARGEHQRHEQWNWRCKHCQTLLCGRCGLGLDECGHANQERTREAFHG